MLETLDTTNIRNLNLEEPVKPERLEFDPEKHVMPIDWEMDLELLRVMIKTEDDPYVIAEQAVNLKLLSPDRFKTLDLKVKFLENFLNDFKKTKVTNIDTEYPDYFVRSIRAASHLKLLFPEEANNPQLEPIMNGLWMGGTVSEAKIFYAVYDRHPDMYLDLLKAMTILKGVADYRYGLDGFDLRRRPELFRRPSIQRAISGNYEYTEAQNLAKLRIIFPGFKPEIDPDSWEDLRMIVAARPLGFREHWNYTAALKILAAKKVRVGEQGIELDMPNDELNLTPNIPALPETRKF